MAPKPRRPGCKQHACRAGRPEVLGFLLPHSAHTFIGQMKEELEKHLHSHQVDVVYTDPEVHGGCL